MVGSFSSVSNGHAKMYYLVILKFSIIIIIIVIVQLVTDTITVPASLARY